MRSIAALVAGFVTLIGAGTAMADPVAYTQVIQPDSCQLFTVDVATGAAAPVGASGDDCVVALARSVDGTLYGVADDEQGDVQLSTIDLTTGVATVVGPVGFSVQGAMFFSLTVDPSGTMWLYANSGAAPCPDQAGSTCLYRVDEATGAGTLVGGADTLVSSLASSCDGQLYATTYPGAFLLDVDEATGATSSIGPVGQGLTLQGAAGGPDGRIWALDALVAELPFRTVAIDPATGVGTVTATVTGLIDPFDAGGLALVPPVCAVPVTTTTTAAVAPATVTAPAFTG